MRLRMDFLRGESFENITPPVRTRGRVDLSGATFVTATSHLGAGQGEPQDDGDFEGLRQLVAGLLLEGLRGGALREAAQAACRAGPQAVTEDAAAWSASEEDEVLGRTIVPGRTDEGGEGSASSEDDAAIHQAAEALVRRRGPQTVVLGGGQTVAPTNQPRWLAAWHARRAAREAEDAVHREMAEVYRAGAQGQFRRWC